MTVYKFALSIIVLLIIVAAMYLIVPQNVESTNPHQQITTDTILDEEALLEIPDENLEINDIDTALEEDSKESIPPTSHDAINTIFKEANLNTITSNIPQKEGIQPLSAIKIHPNSIAKIKIGDTIVLPFMDDATYNAKISTKIKHQNGSISITGNLIDTDNTYSITLTQGKKSAFGSITTPDGAYEIEMRNGNGYVYSVEDIDNNRIDYDHTDVMHVTHPR